MMQPMNNINILERVAQNSSVMQIVNAYKRGENPIAMIRQMACNDPVARDVMKIMQGKSQAQLKEAAQNLANNYGANIDDIARSLGISIPSNR